MSYQLITWILRLKTFCKSLFWHISLGLPKTPKDIINSRYQICLSCDSYDQQYAQCTECGCNINNKSQFLNKLAWADQECPLNKWKKIV